MASLQEILDAREQRAQRQQTFLCQYQKPLICFTMNIPGPEKWNRDVSIGFSVGNWMLKRALSGLPVIHRQLYRQQTGWEAFYIVDMPAQELKKLTLEIENTDPIGRLFDMDVIDTDGKKISREELGYPRRTCLICNNDAYLCAGRRSHNLSQLQDRTGFLLYLAARQWMCEHIGAQAYLALNQEFTTTPKPGLVDKNNRGAHKDMGIGHFFASANALRPQLVEFAEAGFLTRDLPPEETFQKIRAIGMQAEEKMLEATGGVNTHKGAIFSLGLLCAAAGRLPPDQWQPERLLSECAAMAKNITANDFAGVTLENAKTAGEKIYAAYGITGVRGQAEDGFPAVGNVGLPILKKALSEGYSFNDAGCITLLHLLASTDDTNLIHRSDRKTQLEIREKLSAFLAQTPFPPLSVIEEMDKKFIDANLSPGGSADLLALTYFLFFLSQI